MKTEWNRQPGPAVVEVLSVGSDGRVRIYGIAGDHPPNILSNIPGPDPITPPPSSADAHPMPANAAPAPCLPPDASVSGWWWLEHPEGDRRALEWSAEDRFWWASWTQHFHPTKLAQDGYAVLGSVTPFAEVEALRAENARLRAGIEDAMGFRQAEDWHGKLYRTLNPSEADAK